jgi:hypothetical protein
MADPLDCIYRKTDLAHRELQSRTRSLQGPTRTVLILVDGRTSVHGLTARLGHPAGPALAELARSGYVEEAMAAPQPLPGPPATTPAPTPAPAPAASGDELARACRAALARLTPHFGPDVEIVAQPLLQAADRAAFNAGLVQIERKLALYLGKAQAAREVADLRLPSTDLR